MFDRTDPGGTYRPNLQPTTTQGAQFEPLAVDFRPPVVRELPDNPLNIFHLLVPESLVEEWVVATNLAAESHISLPDTPKPWSRLQRWRPTCTSEIYLFMAILISMENHEETAVQDYWKSSIMDSAHPFYPWTRYMTLNRFEQLWRYIRVYNGEPIPQGSVNKAYLSIDEWSDHIQDTMATLYVPGSHVAVDECMQGFTGKSRLKTFIPNKPTPEGIKIWVLAQDGIFLRWLWHIPNKGPVGLCQPNENDLHINPTQRVVVSLLKMLPPGADYHVYLDNLFSSPNLFKNLYDQGIAASGTARLNCGIHEDLVLAKRKKPDASQRWGWSLQIPTECNRV